MNIQDFLKQIGATNETITGLNAKQGPGIVGKQTTTTLGTIAGFVAIGAISAWMHSITIFCIGGGFLALYQIIALVTSIITALKIPNQGLDQVHLLIDRHPELGRLIAKGIEEPIEADFRPAPDVENKRKPKELPANAEDDTPDASDDTEEQDGEDEENK